MSAIHFPRRMLKWLFSPLLAGVFDPPPEALVVPWLYLGLTAAIALACAAVAIVVMRRLASSPDLEALRTR